MRPRRMLLLIAFSGLLTAGLPSCVAVKEYQKQYLNDAEMELTARQTEKIENSFQSYREGAAGATGGKTGGGCGCN